MKQTYGQIGILQPPTGIGFVKTIDPVKVFPPGGKIAGHYPLPTMSRKLAQRIENRDWQEREQAVDIALPSCFPPLIASECV
jgi:hypothetical protein